MCCRKCSIKLGGLTLRLSYTEKYFLLCQLSLVAVTTRDSFTFVCVFCLAEFLFLNFGFICIFIILSFSVSQVETLNRQCEF